MGLQQVPEMDYRSRLKDFLALEEKRNGLMEEILQKLDTVTAQLETVTNESAREVSVLKADLEDQKKARRGWQDEAAAQRERLASMEQARFVLVLIDADADPYIFHDKYLSRGLKGGQTAAEQLMEKVREHLASLGSAINDPKTVSIMVKAYANLGGLAQACVRDKKLSSLSDMTQFWVGFSRRYPLVDFIDVGLGKEEADSKLKEVLNFHFGNPLCEHVMLACCHDAGYVPALRQYTAQPKRITLVTVGPVGPAMHTLGFRTTRLFEPLFSSRISPQVTSSPMNGKVRESSVSDIQQTLDLITAMTAEGSSQVKEKPVNNCGRLRPIFRNDAGKRIDKVLSVDRRVLQDMRERNLCSWHYLRSDCQKKVSGSCKRNHEYPRPLNPGEYDAQWFIARQGVCYTLRKGGNCQDDQCIYGHGGL